MPANKHACELLVGNCCTSNDEGANVPELCAVRPASTKCMQLLLQVCTFVNCPAQVLPIGKLCPTMMAGLLRMQWVCTAESLPVQCSLAFNFLLFEYLLLSVLHLSSSMACVRTHLVAAWPANAYAGSCSGTAAPPDRANLCKAWEPVVPTDG